MYLKGNGSEVNSVMENAAVNTTGVSDKKYKYDAFISYRHGGVDAFVAKELHKLLEGYKLPGGVKSPTGKKKITRVFKDTEELPLASNLSDPITEALAESEYLIVICSPRLNESEWCKTEIKTFISMHGRENVFCVVAEGEPVDVFPMALTMDENGSPLEPLAADFRGTSNGDIKKKMKQEYIRLIAPMFKLGYDDIKRRERENRIKSIMRSSIMIAVAAVILGAYFAYTSFQLSEKNKMIEEQADAIMEQSLEISSQAEEIADQNQQLKVERAKAMSEASLNYLAQDRIGDALQYAYDAAVFNQDALPYTAGTQLALSSALRLYENGYNYVAVDQIAMQGTASCIKGTNEGQYAILGDQAGYMVIYDCMLRRQVYNDYVLTAYDVTRSADSIDEFAGFISDTVIYYVDDNNELVIYDIAASNEVSRIALDDVLSVKISESKNYLAVHQYGKVNIYSTDDFDSPTTIIQLAGTYGDIAISDEAGCLFYSESTALSSNDEMYIHVYDMYTGEEKVSSTFEGYSVTGMVVHEGYLYILISGYEGSMLNTYTEIVKYDYSTGESIWNYTSKQQFCYGIIFDEASHALVYGTYECRVIDCNTGEGSDSIAYDANLAGSFWLAKNGYFAGIDENGLLMLVNPDTAASIAANFVMCAPLMDANHAYAYILGAPKGANRIILYDRIFNGDAKPYSGEVILDEEMAYFTDTELASFIEQYDVPNPRFIKGYVTKGDIAYIGYGDNSLKVFNLKTMTLLSDIAMDGGMYSYLGEDAYGNHYVKSSMETYCLNESYELIGCISSFKGFSEDRKNIIIQNDLEAQTSSEAIYAIPVYQYDELVEMAGEALNEH